MRTWRTKRVSGMKIYFGFTVAGDRSCLLAARKIVDLLSLMGHEVLTRHLVNDDAWEADRRISPQEVYARDMDWLRQCELFVAEVSGSTFGLGFETGYLLGATSKTIILFYRREMAGRISLLISGNTHPNCRLAPYSDLDEIDNLLAEHLSQVHFPSPDCFT
jgi:2'-deoxynucleoside 5'-phosphate N-hydrolase